jgi:hypothetical protein
VIASRAGNIIGASEHLSRAARREGRRDPETGLIDWGLKLQTRRLVMLFTVETEQETDGRWIAEVQELSGALKYGRTRDEAIALAEAGSSGFPVAKILNKNRFLVCWP